MKMNLRKLLAAVLAMVMVLSAVGTVMADDAQQRRVQVNNADVTMYDNQGSYPFKSHTFTGDLEYEGDSEKPVMTVYAYGFNPEKPSEATFTLNGNVKGSYTADSSDSWSSVVIVAAEGLGASASVTVDGRISAITNNELGNGKAAYVSSSQYGSSGNDDGSFVSSSLNIKEGTDGQVVIATRGGTSTLTIDEGGVNAKNIPKEPIRSINTYNKITGAVIVENSLGTIDTSINGEIVSDGTGIVSDTMTTMGILTNGMEQIVNATGDGNGEISTAEETPAANTTIKIEGDVEVAASGSKEQDEGATATESKIAGIDLQTLGDNAKTSFTLKGNLNVNGEDEAQGVVAKTYDNATLALELIGSTTVSASAKDGKAVGIQLINEGANVSATLNGGDINVTGKNSTGLVVEASTAVYYTAETGKMRRLESREAINVWNNPNLKPEDKVVIIGGLPYKLYSLKLDSVITYYVTPNIAGELMGIPGSLINNDQPGAPVNFSALEDFDEIVMNSNTSVSVTGSVTAGTYGTVLKADKDSKADLFIDGVVKGDEASMVLSDEAVIGDNVTLTVWKLENADEKFVTRREAGGDNTDNLLTAAGDNGAAENTELKNISDEEYGKIQYIIRIEAGQEDYIETDAGKKVNGYDVAIEKQKVTLMLTPPEGYEITGAFNGEGDGKVELTKDDEGNYYVTVERGGGVYLSIEYKEKKEETPVEPDDKQEEKKDDEKKDDEKKDDEKKDDGKKDDAEPPKLEPEQPIYKTVTIDPDGGIVENRKNADKYTMSVVQGATFTLPKFDKAKEGCELLGWYVSDVGRGQAGWVEPDPEKDADKFLKPGTKITVDKSLTLTAIWKKAE